MGDEKKRFNNSLYIFVYEAEMDRLADAEQVDWYGLWQTNGKFSFKLQQTTLRTREKTAIYFERDRERCTFSYRSSDMSMVHLGTVKRPP
jgi:hypothetical protein